MSNNNWKDNTMKTKHNVTVCAYFKENTFTIVRLVIIQSQGIIRQDINEVLQYIPSNMGKG